ncbi:exopolysaccharide Pel transporter PelG [Mobilitalea sibirica]|uniref:Exopolysaccharide Pel transporter PelG n=1 Tax=Mobilitalea sibirica TaxID=1462919 RepID=A0A8J7KTL8_9FIRM|nr:exopolysaccharide Pel transporter PelG [Mobilitalea sibirica]MBH1941526.1 exopolysaccharide Pel transporter PelG [Mobilitalea sibirica]
MAGVGFELRKIFKDETIHGKVKGVIYASMTTIGPTIMFMLLLLGIRYVMNIFDVPYKEQIFFSSASLYLFIFATMISGALNTISTRFISDMIFIEKDEYIPATMFGTIMIGSFAAAIPNFIICIVLFAKYDINPVFLIGYYLFGIMITVTYCIMTFISAIKEYAKITASFFVGLLSAVAIFFIAQRYMGLSVINCIIYSLALGFLLINVFLIYYIITFFEKSNHRYFEFLKYYIKYPKLFLSGLFYVLGLYISNIIFWFYSDIATVVTLFHVAPSYDMATFLAVIVNLSAIVIYTVKVETQFFEKYKLYVMALNNANYAVIEKARKNMNNTIHINLFFIYEIQLIITIILTCLSVMFFPMLGIGGLTLDFFLLLGIAYYAIFSMYFTVVFLYYFSDQFGSFIATALFFGVTVIASLIAIKLGNGYYAIAPLTGAIVGWIYAFLRLKYILKDINANIFCGILK